MASRPTSTRSTRPVGSTGARSSTPPSSTTRPCLPFGFTDISGDITQLKNSGAQFVGTCMDPTGNTVLSKGLQEAGLYNQVKQYWPNGYDQSTLNQFAPLMEGVYFQTGFVPYA